MGYIVASARLVAHSVQVRFSLFQESPKKWRQVKSRYRKDTFQDDIRAIKINFEHVARNEQSSGEGKQIFEGIICESNGWKRTIWLRNVFIKTAGVD